MMIIRVPLTGLEEIGPKPMSPGVAPHDFVRLRLRDGLWFGGCCRHCLLPRFLHPVYYWSEARALGDRTSALGSWCFPDV